MINKLNIATKPFREKFGVIRGIIIWISLLKEKITKPGHLFSVRVPGVSTPIHLRAETSDVEAFCQIFVHGELDAEINHPVEYIIDAGANIGLASVYFANRFPSALIDALEIDKNNINVFQLNTNKYNNVNMIPEGLWDCISTLRIINPGAESWAFRVEKTDSEDPDGFPATTISELLRLRKKNRIDILKVDIEGAEKEVFSGDTSWLSQVGTLFVELHDRLKQGCTEAVYNACSRIAYKKTMSGEYHVIEFVGDSLK